MCKKSTLLIQFVSSRVVQHFSVFIVVVPPLKCFSTDTVPDSACHCLSPRPYPVLLQQKVVSLIKIYWSILISSMICIILIRPWNSGCTYYIKITVFKDRIVFIVENWVLNLKRNVKCRLELVDDCDLVVDPGSCVRIVLLNLNIARSNVAKVNWIHWIIEYYWSIGHGMCTCSKPPGYW